MNIKKFFCAMGEIDERYVNESIGYNKNRKVGILIKGISVAACVAVVLCAAYLAFPKNKIPLSEKSNGVTVKYVKTAPQQQTADSLAYLTEQELFAKYNTAVFSGEVVKADNIQMDFNGIKNYRAVVQIKVQKVYRGDCSVGDTVSVMLPCTLGTGVQVTDTHTVSNIKVGTVGIFMPTEYDENSKYIENGATLMLKDIADYGFADGERYAFLQAEDGLIFARFAYPSIESATSLSEIEDYILKMIE